MIFGDDGRPVDHGGPGTETTGGPKTLPANEGLFDGKYRIVKKLGAGGMGEVYLATDTKLRIDVAIKMMYSIDPSKDEEGERKKRFIREAQIAASLDNNNIVRVKSFDTAVRYDILTGAKVEVPYIVMDYVKDGFTLAQELKRRGTLPIDETIGILRQIAEALDYAHTPYGDRTEPIIHRDVKPGNIILQRKDGKLIAKLLDFGISKPLAQGSGAVLTLSDMGGTRAYMAPERLVKTCQPTIAEDIYSFAATAYECLVGKPPVSAEGKDLEIYARIEKSWQEGTLVCPYPESSFAKAVMRGLSIEPNDRPKSCKAFFGEENGTSQKTERKRGHFHDFTFSLERDELEWSGSELTPHINIEPSGRLTERKDFALEYENNKDVGEARVAIVGKYHYRGCVVELTFRIVPRQIAKAVVADIPPYEYTGQSASPNIRVSDPERGEDLEQDRDYLVKVLGDGRAGKAEVVIDGKGNYCGKLKTTFLIQHRDIANATVSFLESPEYNGHPVHPKIALKDNGLKRDLKEGEDYSVKFGDDVEKEGRLTVFGKGNYDGTFGMPFKIRPRDIGKATVDLPPSVRFEGHPIATIPVKVYDSALERDLKEGEDYYVECRNANGPGEGVVCVKGKGRYRGELAREFQIAKGRFDVVGRLTTRVEYDGKPHGIDVKVGNAPKGMRLLYARSQGGPYAREPIRVRDVCGETQIWFRIECEGFESYSGMGSVEICPKSVADLKIGAIEEQVFIGSPVCPKVVVSDPVLNVELKRGRDFELRPNGSGDVGRACVTIVGKGNYGGKRDCPFKILPKYIYLADVSAIPVQIYDGSPKRPMIDAKDVELGRDLIRGRDYDLQYGDEKDVGTGTVRLIGKKNYRGVKPLTFQIVPRGMTKVKALPIKPVRYKGHPIENVDVELRDMELGRTLKRGKDYEIGSCAMACPFCKRPIIDKHGVFCEQCGHMLPSTVQNADRPGAAFIEIVGLGMYRGGTLHVAFEIQEGEFDVEWAGFGGEYDGQRHGISVLPVDAPPTTRIAYSLNEEGPYKDEAPTFCDVCKAKTVWFRIACAGYKTFCGKATVEVRPRQLTRQTIDVGIEPPMAKEDVSACPVVKLVDKSLDKVLVLKADYTLESRNTGREGFGCVVIKGQGNYTGEIVEEFAFRRTRGILAENVVFQWPSGLGEVSAIARDPESGKFLKQGTDFRLEVWNDHPELGWMMARVTGVGDYDGEIIGRHMKTDQRFESLLLCLSGLRYALYKGDAYLVKLKADVEGRSIALTDLLGGVTIDLNGFRIVSGKRPPFILAHDEDAMQRLGFVGDFPEVGMPLPEWKDCATSLKIVNSRPGANSGVYCDCDAVVSVSRGTSWMATFALDDSVVLRRMAP